MQNLVTAHMK